MTEELPLCECGCGERISKHGNRFIWGHNRQNKSHTPEACATMSAARKGIPKPPRTPEHCASLSKASRKSDAVKAHNESMRGVSLSPEHCDAISAATTGVPKPPRTPKHIAAIVRGQEESGMYEAMRGGNDILKHHHIYDHDDLSKYTIEMTRSQHVSLHRNMQTLGLKIPHINTIHENEEELKLMEYIRKI